MSNTSTQPDLETSANAAAEDQPGGGRSPGGPDSYQIRPLTTSTQIFKIPDEGDPVLQRFILKNIQFHVAVFPYFSIPNSSEH